MSEARSEDRVGGFEDFRAFDVLGFSFILDDGQSIVSIGSTFFADLPAVVEVVLILGDFVISCCQFIVLLIIEGSQYSCQFAKVPATNLKCKDIAWEISCDEESTSSVQFDPVSYSLKAQFAGHVGELMGPIVNFHLPIECIDK